MHQVFRNVVGLALGIPFIWIGIRHFHSTELFNPIVPSYLGWPSFWTLVSGALEIALGVGIVIPRWRRLSSRALFLLVILMSLANLNMWVNNIPFNGTVLSTTGHVVRWVLQFILLATLLWLGEAGPWRRAVA